MFFGPKMNEIRDEFFDKCNESTTTKNCIILFTLIFVIHIIPIISNESFMALTSTMQLSDSISFCFNSLDFKKIERDLFLQNDLNISTKIEEPFDNDRCATSYVVRSKTFVWRFPYLALFSIHTKMKEIICTNSHTY